MKCEFVCNHSSNDYIVTIYHILTEHVPSIILIQAILGVQIVITMIMASIMSKVGPYMSFARWILTTSGLIRYMHPTDEELKSLIMIPRDKKSKKGSRKEDRLAGRNGHSSDNGVFNVPRSLDIQLETTKVTTTEVIQLRYYTEYQWLVDFSFHALLVYILTEVILILFVTLGERISTRHLK